MKTFKVVSSNIKTCEFSDCLGYNSTQNKSKLFDGVDSSQVDSLLIDKVTLIMHV